MSRQVILQYMYRLTIRHCGNCGDVPFIEVSVEVSVESVSISKHCRKKRRPMTFTVNARKERGRALTGKGGRALIRTLIKYGGSKRRQTSCTTNYSCPHLLNIDILDCILVTFATFHLLTSPLKALVELNTVSK
jgi:hypothetical protein